MTGLLPIILGIVALVVLVVGVALAVRRWGNRGLSGSTNRGRMPRLAVIDAAAVDGRRRLVLVRRDNVEHLLMIGGPSDIVVEPNIVRSLPGREQMAPRPAVAGEAPPRIAPLPDANWNDDSADHPEPQLPEPPPRPARPAFADEVRRPAPPPMPERRPERAERVDPLAGFAPEPLAPRAEPRPEPSPPRLSRTERSEPMLPRPPRPMEPPKAPPVRAPERAAAPPPPPPPPPQSADQNLAEMAQRLEAALRRPAEPAIAPPVAPEPPPARPARSEAPPPPAPQKTGFENLEDEMASLLGRPKSPS